MKWHPITNEPRIGSYITVITASNNVYSFYYKSFNENDVEWCYTNDLIPRPATASIETLRTIAIVILYSIGVLCLNGVFFIMGVLSKSTGGIFS